MARLFNDAAIDYLGRADVCGITDYPVTMACFFNVDTDAVNHTLMSIADADTLVRHDLRLRDAPDTDITETCSDGVGYATVVGAGYATGSWHHACTVLAGDQERHLYYDGGNKASNTTDSENWVGTADNTTIGALRCNSATSYPTSGHIAEAAIWNVALTDAEVASLAKGFSPLLIRPGNLVAYWPLIRGLNDRVGGFNLTASGTTVSPHPRVIYPTGILVPSFAPSAIKYASGTIAGQSSLSATGKATKKVVGSMGALSTAVVTPSLTRKVTGTIAAAGALAGSVKVTRQVTGTIAGQSTLSATAWEMYTLVSGTIAATAFLIARATVEKWSGAATPGGAWDEKTKPTTNWTETQKPQGNWQEN